MDDASRKFNEHFKQTGMIDVDALPDVPPENIRRHISYTNFKKDQLNSKYTLAAGDDIQVRVTDLDAQGYYKDKGVFDRVRYTYLRMGNGVDHRGMTTPAYICNIKGKEVAIPTSIACLLYTSPSPRDGLLSRMPSSA